MPQMSPLMWSVFPVVMVMVILVGVVLLHKVEAEEGESGEMSGFGEKKQW